MYDRGGTRRKKRKRKDSRGGTETRDKTNSEGGGDECSRSSTWGEDAIRTTKNTMGKTSEVDTN